ncbi:hypothetical protein H5V45_10260 [Nocardioides sp. KIGAM211]|uniref:Uncharacterized protein n=1 Tax=Nocardioides luti TaxID=2761101 RepID=A0A7X0VBZ7_9ACTN|nr:hypothetical protein [Nocardioides luti]MBB6627703.1 hypothetical protein [Nocardioides luti]
MPHLRRPRRLAVLTVAASLLVLPLVALAPLTAGAAPAPTAAGVGLADKGGDADPGDDPANNTKADLNLVTGSLPSLQAGQEGWVSLIWSAGTDVCDVEVTTKSKDVVVTYPTNTGDFSSLYINNALAETNTDYTAFKLTAPAAAGSYPVEFEATFTRLKDSATLKKSDNLVHKDVDNCSGSSGKVKQTINLPVTAASGAAVSLQTPSLQLKAGAPSWVALAFKGNAPGLENFRVTVTAPAGFEVVYPGDGTSSGLAQGTKLGVGVTDSTGVRITAVTAAAGTYQLPVKATWTGGSFTGTVTVKVVP